MCGIFGFLNYSGKEMKDLSEFTNALAMHSVVRGSDATGIAYCNAAGINISKDGKSAYNLEFKHSDKITSVIGHTRNATQGDEKFNYNNHPFFGKCKNTRFALIHNGVLSNDKDIRIKYNLPKTKIETDSYIAVQILESKGYLDFDSIKLMAETTEGSFAYSMLDESESIWLVKGSSPISILHFPGLELYAFASTEDILYKACVDYEATFTALSNKEFEPVDITEGEILKIRADGKIERGKFDYCYYYGRNWWDFEPYFFNEREKEIVSAEDTYIKEIKEMASYLGYSRKDIDKLFCMGLTMDEVVDYLYCGGEI